MTEQKSQSAIENLAKLKDLIPVLSYEDNFDEWRSLTQKVLEEIIGANSEKALTFKAINYTPLFMSTYMSVEKMEELFKRGLSQAEALLNEAIMELET